MNRCLLVAVVMCAVSGCTSDVEDRASVARQSDTARPIEEDLDDLTPEEVLLCGGRSVDATTSPPFMLRCNVEGIPDLPPPERSRVRVAAAPAAWSCPPSRSESCDLDSGWSAIGAVMASRFSLPLNSGEPPSESDVLVATLDPALVAAASDVNPGGSVVVKLNDRLCGELRVDARSDALVSCG